MRAVFLRAFFFPPFALFALLFLLLPSSLLLPLLSSFPRFLFLAFSFRSAHREK
jgi:hypothetical protein